MGDCIRKAKGNSKREAVLRDWLEASYDFTDEIRSIIRDAEMKSNEEDLYFTLNVTVSKKYMPSLKELRSVAQCPAHGVLSKVQHLLSHVSAFHKDSLNDEEEKEDAKEENEKMRYLPCSLSDKNLFALLPHLVHPGTMFTIRPSCCIAIMCARQGKETRLGSRAHRYLTSMKGKWLPPVKDIDRPELLSVEFVSFMATFGRDFLTEEERYFYVTLHSGVKLRRAANLKIEILVPYTPTTKKQVLDEKDDCVLCKKSTSRTLLNTSRVCGLCVWESYSVKNRWARPHKGHKSWCDKNHSFMVKCCKCRVLYAVVGPEDLGVSPKCHYCRFKKHTPAVRCVKCSNRFLRPGMSDEDIEIASKVFLCSVCQSNPKDAFTKIRSGVRFADLVLENPILMNIFGYVFIFLISFMHTHSLSHAHTYTHNIKISSFLSESAVRKREIWIDVSS